MKVQDIHLVIKFERSYEEMVSDLKNMKSGDICQFKLTVTDDKSHRVALESIRSMATKALR